MLPWPNLTFDLNFYTFPFISLIPQLSRYQFFLLATHCLIKGNMCAKSFLNTTTHNLLRVQTTILTNSTSDLKDRKYHIDYKNVSCAWDSVSSRLTFVPSNILICHFGTGQSESGTTDARMDGPIHGQMDALTHANLKHDGNVVLAESELDNKNDSVSAYWLWAAFDLEIPVLGIMSSALSFASLFH